MKHGDAERVYDFMVLQGLDPVPWQHEFLRKWEQRSMDEQFASIVAAASVPPSPQPYRHTHRDENTNRSYR